MSVKLRKVGTSKVLTVPNNIKTTHKEFNVFKGRMGNIIYSPVTKNPFKNPKFIKKHHFNGDRTGFINAGVSNHES